ncbi:MAG: heparan-alpha-glucosaminide N-acetyltransferase domain-containing protein [Mucilaginibacter sp.]
MLQTKRLLSIDVFRAVNMFFMIFVNDLSGVKDVPGWIDHVKGYEDGMHFADTIFPLFLFIAGLSVPLAIGRRISKGDSFSAIAGYILLRSFALIVMGFFHVNMEDYSEAAILPLGVWELLLTIGFFLIWMDYPETLAKTKRYALMGAGVLILIILAVLYKGGPPSAPRGLEPSWWGILGIIGWAYLVCAGVYLLVKGNFTALIIALVLLIAINICVHGKLLHLKIWVIKDGASAGLMMFGVVVSLLYSKIIARGSYKWVWPVFTLGGVALIALGFFVRPYTQGISKIHSTPAWVFLCTGIGVLLFELLIWLIDVKGKQHWFKVIKPAGTSTLTCYLIPYLIVAIFYIIHFRYPHFLDYGNGGIIRSFCVAFIVIIITGFLEKRRLRLKI